LLLLLRDNAVYKPVLHRFAFVLACATLVLIAAGGLVTSTESGLSVPDWPLSYGQWFPPMIGGIRYEHTHRVIAGSVGLLTLAAALLFWKLENRSWVRNLALAAFGAVVLQAVLGGITVIYLLPTVVSVAHACLGQTFFCLVSVLAFVTSRRWIEDAPVAAADAGRARALFAATAGMAFVQLILGAWVRHTGRGVVLHITGALAVVVLGLLSAAAIEGGLGALRLLAIPGRFFIGLILAQVFLGVGAFLTTQTPRAGPPDLFEVLFTTAHQAFGALVLMTAVLIAVTAFGRLKASA
jgi:cytochrome c oxidase assembly protein subunit 15